MRRLAAVGACVRAAEEINKAAGCFYWPIAARSRDIEAPAKVRIASAAQVEKWPELAAYRAQWKQRPDLLWVAIVPVTVITGRDADAVVAPVQLEEVRNANAEVC